MNELERKMMEARYRNEELAKSIKQICNLLSLISPQRIKLESSGWAQKKCLEILFPPVIGKPKVKVTFGNFSEGKRQPSAEDFAEGAFGSAFR